VHEAIDGHLIAAGEKRHTILVTSHRRENFDGGIQRIVTALKKLAEREDCFILFPVHPNPNVQEPVRAALGNHPRIRLLPPLDYVPFVRVLSLCHFVITDSGGVQEEAPALGKPVLIMRDTTERPEGIEAGTALLVGTDPDNILFEARRLLEDAAHYQRMSRAHNPFGDGKASLRILSARRTADRELRRRRAGRSVPHQVGPLLRPGGRWARGAGGRSAQ
jgi:UDP-N-acetylglucosamine 2-epimerase